MHLQQVAWCVWTWIIALQSTNNVSAFGPPLKLQRGRGKVLLLSPATTSQLFASTSSQKDDGEQQKQQEDLLSKAARLRQEAQELETKLRSSRTTPAAATTASPAPPPPPVYRDAKDSVWTFSYRFAAMPEKKDDKKESSSPSTPVPKFSGKLTLWFRPDGYTDLVQHEPSSTAGPALDIVKAWGWDLETSTEDEKDYVLFSIDALVPDTDNNRKERFYFQARQEKDSTTGAIVLKEGTVTVKQDVTEQGGPSLWGLFSPKGILARFMYTGDFVAKPAARKQQ